MYNYAAMALPRLALAVLLLACLRASAPVQAFPASIPGADRVDATPAADTEQQSDTAAFVAQAPSLFLRSFLAVWVGIVFAAVIAYFRRSALDSKDATTWWVGSRTYKIYSVTGTVAGATRGISAHTEVWGNDQYVSSRVVKHEHHRFSIVHAAGELPVKLTDSDMPVRDGHYVSAVWAIRAGKKTGRYIAYHNHMTKQTEYRDGEMRSILRPRFWPCLIVVLLAWSYAIWTFLSTPFDQYGVPMAFLIAGHLTTWGVIMWLVLRFIVSGLRTRRFRQVHFPRLITMLDERALAAAGVVKG